MKNISLLAVVFIAFSAHAQLTKKQTDSVALMKQTIQDYRKAVDHDSSAYNPYLHASAYNDSLFNKAVVWKKRAVDIPLILKYLQVKDTTSPESRRIIAKLDSSEQDRVTLLEKATAYYQHNTGSKSYKGIVNHDEAIKDSILKTWKF